MAAKASAPGVRLLDVGYYDVGGREGDYLSLGHDALAPVVAQQAEEADKRTYGWNKMLDALWVTVPLLILAAVIIWTLVKAPDRAVDEMATQQKEIQAFSKQSKEMMRIAKQRIGATYWPAYVGQLHAADRALLVGDVVRARQALVACKPLPADEDQADEDQ